MLSNISFGSTYKVSTRDNSMSAFSKFQKFAIEKEYRDVVRVKLEDNFGSRINNTPYQASYTMVVPNSMDYDVETFCASRGIVFDKYNTDYITQPEIVLDRIECPPKGMKKIKIDVDKLYELIENQSHNIDYCEKQYHRYYKSDIDFMLKSGDKIPASTFSIVPMYGKTQDTVEYINRYGENNLNENQLHFGLAQITDDPDHCVFFALKEMGIKEIPVYAYEDTCKIAQALGISK